jgi:hypothetical protein
MDITTINVINIIAVIVLLDIFEIIKGNSDKQQVVFVLFIISIFSLLIWKMVSMTEVDMVNEWLSIPTLVCLGIFRAKTNISNYPSAIAFAFIVAILVSKVSIYFPLV